MIRKKLIATLLMGICFIVACKPQHETGKQSKQITVKPQAMQKSLYFTGNIQPIHESSLTSSVDAVVESMPVHYGQIVKKGEVIMTLSSNELQRQYYETLTEYLKAKDNYSIVQSKFNGSKELWEAGLISKNNYLSEKSSLDTARISLIQATKKLSDMLDKLDDPGERTLSSLSLSEFDKVKSALNTQHNLIRIRAPHDGILLYPPKSGDDKNARVTVGASVKSGQVLALVGDLSGVRVEIDVPEIDIVKIHAGMKATITGVALGPNVLAGQLIAVNAQASLSSGGGLPSFNAVVVVDKLTPKQRNWIKVGMSAAIELAAETENKLMVPIAAVSQENGVNVVRVKTAKGQFEPRVIKTGPTEAGQVVIESGLKNGDVVEYG